MRKRNAEEGEVVSGGALAKRLSAGLMVYGFACQEHGLRFYAVASPGTAVTSEHIRAVEGAALPRLGRLLVCDQCGGVLGWLSPDIAVRSMVVPASALRDLEAICNAERSRRRAEAQRGAR